MVDDPDGEGARVDTLRRLGVLDTPEEERFDRIVALARQVFGVQYAAVNLVDADRQWSKAHQGLPVPRELPRSDGFCSTTIEGSHAVVVPDARADERFRDHSATNGDLGVRFYAGQPLTVDGQRVGALCLVDQSPRDLDAGQVALLEELGRWVELELTRDSEMRQAAEVQRRLLPTTTPDLPGLEVSGRCVQSRAVGGDFFDWFVTDGCLQAVLADVMGKGLSAALHAATVRATLRTAGHFNTLKHTVRKAARSIAADLEGSGAFVTAFLARVDPERGRVEYVDAGHGLGIVIDAGGRLRRLLDDQPPLGLDLGHEWSVRETVLEPGDTLVVVSDGFLDFFETQEEVIRTAEAVGAAAGSASALVDAYIDFAAERAPEDDVSVLAVRRAA